MEKEAITKRLRKLQVNGIASTSDEAVAARSGNTISFNDAAEKSAQAPGMIMPRRFPSMRHALGKLKQAKHWTTQQASRYSMHLGRGDDKVEKFHFPWTGSQPPSGLSIQ
jgi:hypothetical protein